MTTLGFMQLMAAGIALGACTDRSPATQAVGNGRAVFENAADTTEATELGAEAADFDTFAVDGAGADGATAGSASQRRWPIGAITSPNAGSVTGHVYDAATGRPITLVGSVSTAAACTGRSCGGIRTRTTRPITTVSLTSGAFAFDAATRQLTLAANTTFRVSVPGYVSVRIAHGPYGAANGVTELPPIYLCRIGSANSDRDGICDNAEARYGTDPRQVDSDGDALSDAAEIYGVWDREVLDIRGLGADPRRTDVLLEIDYVPNRAPTAESIGAVVAAFDQALPRPGYPNNKPGIALHAWIDDQVDDVEWVDYPNYNNTAPIIQNWFNLRSRWPTHYGLFANKMWDSETNQEDWSSGISPTIPGDVFYVTLRKQDGSDPTDADKARTLMHELGHNLGLQHGGGEPTNYKPNYFSVMNYLYQFDAIPTAFGDWRDLLSLMDYSRFATPALVESALDERTGMNPTYPASDGHVSTLINPWYCRKFDTVKAGDCVCFGQLFGGVPGEIDFNNDEVISDESVAADLNGMNGTADTIQGTTNDWESLDFSAKKNVNIPQRTVDTERPCPAPPSAPTIVDRTVADGGTAMDEVCPPTTTLRVAADGGEDAAVLEDAAVDAEVGIDIPWADGGVRQGETEPGSTDAGTWGGDVAETDAAAQTDTREEEPRAANGPMPPEEEPMPPEEEPMSGSEPMPPANPGPWEEPGPWQDPWASAPPDGGVE